MEQCLVPFPNRMGTARWSVQCSSGHDKVGHQPSHIFGLGMDHQMYHKAWNGNMWVPSPLEWEALGGEFDSPPAVASWGPDRLDIFGLGVDKQMYHKAWDGQAWFPSLAGWEPLGGAFNSPPAVVSWGANRLDLFGLGADNQMYHKAWDGNAWFPSASGWEALGGAFDSQPAVASWGYNRLDIFGLGTDEAMYHKAWDGSGWYPSATGWELLGGAFNSAPAVAAWGKDRLDIFGLGTNNEMYHKAWDGSAWRPSVSSWEPLGGTFDPSPHLAPATNLSFAFDPITFGGGVPVGGSSHITVRQDGTYNFSGHFHDSGATEYNLNMIGGVKDSANRVYTFQQAGHVAGTFEPGSRDYDWNIDGQNPAIAANWADLARRADPSMKASASSDLTNLTNELIGAAGLVLAVVAVV